MRFAKIGSVLYILWGSLHLGAAIEQFGFGVSLDTGLIQGKIFQGAWDLVFFSIACILFAILYNWKNDPIGYWFNLFLVSAADLGFIFFVFIPGYVTFFPGILGPVLWISAVTFTTIGIRRRFASPQTV